MQCTYEAPIMNSEPKRKRAKDSHLIEPDFKRKRVAKPVPHPTRSRAVRDGAAERTTKSHTQNASPLVLTVSSGNSGRRKIKPKEVAQKRQVLDISTDKTFEDQCDEFDAHKIFGIVLESAYYAKIPQRVEILGSRKGQDEGDDIRNPFLKHFNRTSEEANNAKILQEFIAKYEELEAVDASSRTKRVRSEIDFARWMLMTAEAVEMKKQGEGRPARPSRAMVRDNEWDINPRSITASLDDMLQLGLGPVDKKRVLKAMRDSRRGNASVEEETFSKLCNVRRKALKIWYAFSAFAVFDSLTKAAIEGIRGGTSASFWIAPALLPCWFQL